MRDEHLMEGPRDPNRVSILEDHELRYWSAAFGVSEDLLRDTVRRVGYRPDDVREALKDV